jgi:hypothetical protein
MAGLCETSSHKDSFMSDNASPAQDLIDAAQAAVRDAYDRGMRDGYAKAMGEAMDRVRSALSFPPPGVKGAVSAIGSAGRSLAAVAQPVASPREGDGQRVARGSVKPMLLAALNGEMDGLTAQDVAAKTGLKDTTTRSKLSELRHAGQVVKVGDRFKIKEHLTPWEYPGTDEMPAEPQEKSGVFS